MNHALLSFSLLSLLLVASCAHHTSKDFVLTAEQKELINREALALASQKLEKMVEAANQNGPSEQHLATNLFLKGNSALMEGDYVTGSVLFSHLVKLTDDPFVHKKFAV